MSNVVLILMFTFRIANAIECQQCEWKLDSTNHGPEKLEKTYYDQVGIVLQQVNNLLLEITNRDQRSMYLQKCLQIKMFV